MTKLPIPAAVLDNHVGILGKTGSGKSNTAKVIVEYLLSKGERVCAIDPTGTWWGLRSNANGNGPGFPVVIFGGQHGDVPLAGAHGAAIAEIVGTSSTPTIIDTRLMSVGERTRFFTAFAEALLRSNRGPLHLIIDEAHLFAPQSGAGGSGRDISRNEMLHAANNLVSLGRGIGLRIILISQRPAKLHKDSLTQVETLVAMRLIAPQDTKAVREWIKEWADEGQGAEIMSSMPSLPTGEGWVWAPGLDVLKRVSFPLASTLDTGNPAVAIRKRFNLAPIDLPAVHTQLEAVKIEAKANDPRELRADLAKAKTTIANLEKQMATAVAKKVVADPEAERKAEDRGYERGVVEGERHGILRGKLEGFTEATKLFDGGIDHLHDIQGRANDRIGSLTDAKDKSEALLGGPKTYLPPAPAPNVPRVHSSTPRTSSANGGDAALTGPQAQFLKALAWWKAIGHAAPTRVQLASIAGWRVTSGHLKNVAGSLRTKGLIDYPTAGTITMTPEGEAVAPTPDLATNLHDSLRAILTGPQRQAFEALLANANGVMTRDDVAQSCGWEPTSGHVKNVLGSMRSLEIIVYPSGGQVALDQWVREGA